MNAGVNAPLPTYLSMQQCMPADLEHDLMYSLSLVGYLEHEMVPFQFPHSPPN